MANASDRELLIRIMAIAERYECTPHEFLDACENNVVGEQISVQLHYCKTGELPK
jgi:hypothetical protein